MVQDKDRGWSKLAQTLASLQGDPHVLVGVQGAQASAGHGDQLTVADVASYNEFGLGVPERSFIRAAIDEHEAALLRTASKLGQGVINGAFAPGQALELLGEHTRGLMIERINNHIAPPNALSTIARKGSSTPLIAHTGQLKNSITYKLVL
jgi:hypothetical protein